MMLFKRLILSLPLLLSLLPSYGLSEPSNPTTDERGKAIDVEVLQQLLNQVDPPSLHSALHEYSPKKFKHGMFMEDRIAVEAIHRDDPPLAASIVSIAKRQGNNTIVSAPAAPSVPASSVSPINLSPSTSQPGQVSTTPPLVVQTSTNEASASPTSVSDNPSPTATSASDQQPTTTNESASTSATPSDDEGTSSRSAGSVYTITNSYGVVVVTTVGGGASTIATASVPPSATKPSSTISTKASANVSKPSSTSVVVYTSTLPNSSRSVITATTIVPEAEGATPTGSAGVTDGTGTGTPTPGLQTGVAVRTGSVLKEMLCMVGGAVGVAMLM